jgi:regulator of sigma E protease
MAIFIFIIGIILFISLIVVHEYGHFVVARRNGVEAEEFAIFFGPTLYKRVTKEGWIFKINLLPLGGYVKLKGEHDSDTEPGSYGAATLWVKTKIMLAGIFNNFVLGIIILTVLAIIGLPQIIPNQFTVSSNQKKIHHAITAIQIGQVLKSSPASRAGLKDGDNIDSIGLKGNMDKITSVDSLQSTTEKFAGQKVIIKYTRNNKVLQTSTVLNTKQEVADSKQKVYLGVAIGSTTSGVNLVRYSWAAPVVALGLSKQIVVLSYQGLGHAVKGLGGIIAGAATSNKSARQNAQTSASGQVVGPIGIIVILKDGSAIGFQFMLFIIALISITLAIMNILPIPGLDGGRLWLTLGARALRHPLTAKSEELVNALGLLLLMILIGVIVYVDIKRFF